MPEITDAELRQFAAYQNLGTPDEVNKKISRLEGENKGYRDEIKDLKAEAVQVPEGGMILDKDKAEQFNAYTALGEPAQVKEAVQRKTELEQQVASLARKEVIRSAAEAQGFDAVALENLPGTSGWTYEVKQETVKDSAGNETTMPVAYVVTAEGQAPKPLSAAIDADPVLSRFKRALVPTSGSDEGTTQRTHIQQRKTEATPPADGDFIAKRIQQQEEKAKQGTNPLLATTTTQGGA